jgi:hypothetical protein
MTGRDCGSLRLCLLAVGVWEYVTRLLPFRFVKGQCGVSQVLELPVNVASSAVISFNIYIFQQVIKFIITHKD